MFRADLELVVEAEALTWAGKSLVRATTHQRHCDKDWYGEWGELQSQHST